jgi:hypothetical protein
MTNDQILQIAEASGITISHSSYKGMEWDVLTCKPHSLQAFAHAIEQKVMGDSEPVAWSYFYTEHGIPFLTLNKPDEEMLKYAYAEFPQFNIRPLYTSPQPNKEVKPHQPETGNWKLKDKDNEPRV